VRLFAGLEVPYFTSGTIYRNVAGRADPCFVRIVDTEEPLLLRVERIKGEVLRILDRHQFEALSQPSPSAALRDPQIDI